MFFSWNILLQWSAAAWYLIAQNYFSPIAWGEKIMFVIHKPKFTVLYSKLCMFFASGHKVAYTGWRRVLNIHSLCSVSRTNPIKPNRPRFGMLWGGAELPTGLNIIHGWSGRRGSAWAGTSSGHLNHPCKDYREHRHFHSPNKPFVSRLTLRSTSLWATHWF